MIVAGELVVGVYRIEGWEATPLQGPTGPVGPSGTRPAPPTGSRSSGGRDEELESRYVGRSVASYLGSGARAATATGAAVAVGAANQVAYVWCGPHGIDRAG